MKKGCSFFPFFHPDLHNPSANFKQKKGLAAELRIRKWRISPGFSCLLISWERRVSAWTQISLVRRGGASSVWTGRFVLTSVVREFSLRHWLACWWRQVKSVSLASPRCPALTVVSIYMLWLSDTPFMWQRKFWVKTAKSIWEDDVCFKCLMTLAL